MGKILDNSKKFFNSLSSEEFEQLLKDFGINYSDIRELTEEEQKAYMKSLKEISKPRKGKL